MDQKDYICLHCSGSIFPKINKINGLPSKAVRKYCSVDCRKSRRSLARDRSNDNRRLQEIFCEHCHKISLRRVRGGKSDAGRFCSRECAFAAISKIAAERAGIRRIAENNSPTIKPSIVLKSVACKTCGACFNSFHYGKKYCSRECMPSFTKNRWEPNILKCGVCSISFTQTKRWQRTCSNECAIEAKRQQNKERRKLECQLGIRANTHRKRARKFGVEFDPKLSTIKVFDRDGWKCKICGVKTPKRLKGKQVDNAPELDHIIPMSLGGGHVWGNVQCACRKCNSMKGATPLGQLGFDIFVS